MKIEILRTSCTKCKMNEKNVIKAGLKAEIMKVENLHKIVDRYDMMNPVFLLLVGIVMKKVLFVCMQNGCRSQMAKGFFNSYSKNAIADSAGIKPAEKIDPIAVQVMKEKNIDISNYVPKVLTFSMNIDFDIIVSMGCIIGCPVTLKNKTIEWSIEDPKGKTLTKYREIRDIINLHVENLISEVNKNG